MTARERSVNDAQIARPEDDEEERLAIEQWEAERLALKQRQQASTVYFVEAVGLDLIKIGYASNVPLRIRSIETSCPVPVRLLGTFPGGPEMERHFHKEFATHRSHREWFRRSPDMDRLLSQLAPPTASPPDVADDVERSRKFYRKYRSRPLTFGDSGAQRGAQ